MSEVTGQQIFDTCKAGLAEAAEALTRALDRKVSISVEEPAALEPSALEEGYSGPGLLVLMAGPAGGACVAVAESSGLLPDWYTQEDPTSRSKLDTLAQELGLILLPEELAPEQFTAKAVENLVEAVRRGQPGDQAVTIRLLAQLDDGSSAELLLLWPLEAPEQIWAGQAPEGQEAAQQADTSEGASKQPSEDGSGQSQGTSQRATTTQPTAAATGSADPPVGTAGSGARPAVSEQMLPPYTRSLLRIELPVSVILARKKQPLAEILKLVPGAIIQFEKSCEEPLELVVGGHMIAKGEAVKVGEMFGLRITSMVLPDERFRPVRPQRKAAVGAK